MVAPLRRYTQHGEMRSFKYEEFSKFCPMMLWVYYLEQRTAKESDIKLFVHKTYLPQWRATSV